MITYQQFLENGEYSVKDKALIKKDSNGDIIEYNPGPSSIKSIYIKKKNIKLLVRPNGWVSVNQYHIVGIMGSAKALRLTFDMQFRKDNNDPRLILQLKFLNNYLGSYYGGVSYNLKTIQKDLLDDSSSKVKEYLKELVEAYLMDNKKEFGFEYLADIDMPSEEIQRYIITNRPDLIGKIRVLIPELKTKHAHEFELSKVDI